MAFIYQFASIAEFSRSKSSQQNKFNISIIGSAANEYPPDVWIELESRSVHNKQIELNFNATAELARKSDIVIITPKNFLELKKILKQLAGSGVLTISEGVGFGELGVMINFFYEEEHLRFEINRKALGEEKIKISSQVLKLARIVE